MKGFCILRYILISCQSIWNCILYNTEWKKKKNKRFIWLSTNCSKRWTMSKGNINEGFLFDTWDMSEYLARVFESTYHIIKRSLKEEKSCTTGKCYNIQHIRRTDGVQTIIGWIIKEVEPEHQADLLSFWKGFELSVRGDILYGVTVLISPDPRAYDFCKKWCLRCMVYYIANVSMSNPTHMWYTKLEFEVIYHVGNIRINWNLTRWYLLEPQYIN